MDRDPFTDQGALLLAESDGCAVWQFHGRGGEGTMTVYQVLPGVMLSFNDFHMDCFESSFVPGRRMLAIDHCREGRKEFSPGDDMLAYTEAGDMELDLRIRHTGTFIFPSHHYHGLTVVFDREIVERSLPEEIRDFPATPEGVVARWELGEYPRVLHGAGTAEPIFAQLYRVPERLRVPYFKVKILELLLHLETMPIPEDRAAPPYFHRAQVEKVKAIRGFLAEHVAENFTQEELSRRFDIPMTPMKSCFRSVYGCAMGAWLVDLRMHMAAELLADHRELTVAEIGGRVGYEDPGKFTEAFKRVMRSTPSEYRKERGASYET